MCLAMAETCESAAGEPPTLDAFEQDLHSALQKQTEISNKKTSGVFPIPGR